MKEKRLMKDGLDKQAVNRIAGSLVQVLPDFPVDSFIKQALDGLDQLELKARVNHLIEVLSRFLPADFTITATILKDIKSVWDYGNEDDPLRGFAAWPLIDYVGVHGLEHPLESLDVLKTLTSFFSAEFAIRPFIVQHFEITYQHLTDWCTDSDPAVRRLASEGSRPRLPWGKRLPQFIADPDPVIGLLARLVDDESETVRRSVANSLNDISKDNPEVVIKKCREWLIKPDTNRQWVVRHATRSLVKQGNPAVFPLLGYTEKPELRVSRIEIKSPRVQLGQALEFTASLHSTATEKQSVVIDYAIHHLKANGKLSPKVFKLKKLQIKPGETISISRRHVIRTITTRKYYAGEHAVEILVNGRGKGTRKFVLV